MNQGSFDSDERWADVPGYGGKYQASTRGNIRRVNSDGSFRMLKPYTRQTGGDRYTYKVWLNSPERGRHERNVLAVVAATWLPAPPGYIVIHRNSMFTENNVENIRFVQRKDLPRIYANRGMQRPVCKLDDQGNVIECYANARQAAEENYMSIRTMHRHLRGEIKKPIITDGIRFRWEEDQKGETHGRKNKV